MTYIPKMLFNILLFIGTAVASGISSFSVPEGCKPVTPVNPGLNAVFYDYPFNNLDLDSDMEYMSSGYKVNNPPVAYAYNVTDLKIDYYMQQYVETDIQNVYGADVNVAHFLVELTGYFYATETGNYTFQVYADDGMLFRIGSGMAFTCCNTEDLGNTGGMLSFGMSNNPTFYLKAGQYYPIAITYANAVYYLAQLELTYTLPSGLKSTGGDFYFNTVNDPSQPCAANIIYDTIVWTGSDVQTSTLPHDSSATEYTIDIFTPQPTTSFTKYWTGSEIVSSIYTESSTVFVEVLKPEVATTTTITWTGSESSSTTIYPSNDDGTKTIEVFVPEPTSTFTTIWTGSEVSKSTYTEDSTVYVEVFTPEAAITRTTVWTGAEASTTTIYPSNLEETIVVSVFVPEPTVSSTIAWTGSEASTTTIYPSNSDGTVTVEVYTPEPTVSTTIAWTGSEASTTTIYPSNADGTVTVEVYTPEPTVHTPEPTVSTTIAWTGSEASTTTIYPSNADGTVTVEVYTPMTTISTSAFPTFSATSFRTSSDYAHITSTLVPKYSNSTITSSSQHSTSTLSKNDISTTVVTVTSCSDGGCTKVPITTGATVVTVTNDEGITSYTTFCPLTSKSDSAPTGSDVSSAATTVLSDSTITKSDISTTVVTVTSCSDGGCTKVPITTGATVVTVTNDEGITSYTTFCPLTTSDVVNQDIKSSSPQKPSLDASLEYTRSETETIPVTTSLGFGTPSVTMAINSKTILSTGAHTTQSASISSVGANIDHSPILSEGKANKKTISSCLTLLSILLFI
ncbi:hypothetical protein CAAN4_F18096 [[Candida] anglica]|uniref:PA14 domain-containing protein n=1 Tax=[Candida] anglica TaxID=148631 RepID=A0ABP0EIQ0_9ASCO